MTWVLPSKVKAQQNLEAIVNGGFESGDLTGWIHSPPEGNVSAVTTNPHSGQYCACVTGLRSGIYQGFQGIPTSSIESVTFCERAQEYQTLGVDLFYSDGSYDRSQLWGYVNSSWLFFDATSHLETGKILNGIQLLGGGYLNGTPVNTYYDDISILYTPPPQQSSTSVSCSPNPVSIGQPVTCTATVSGSNPTGTVTWSASSSTGSFSQSVCTLSNGSCSTFYTDNSTGSETITASYSGDSNVRPSSGSATLTVFINITVGVNVTVDPTSDLELTFSNVTAEGHATTDKTSTVEAPVLANLVGQYYDVRVTANYSGSVTVSLAYDDTGMGLDREGNLQMMQYTPIPGDVVNYGEVNILDVFLIAHGFGATPESANWNAAGDITGSQYLVPDGKIDIRDIFVCARNFSKTSLWTSIMTHIDTELNIVRGETTHFSIIGIH